MSWLYFNQYSISSLAQLIIAFIVILYFFSLKKKTKRAWYRALFFLFLTGYFLAAFLSSCVYAPWGIYFITMQYSFLVIAVTFFIQFGYNLPRNDFEKESQFVFISSCLISAGMIVFLIWKANEFQSYLPTEHLFLNGIILGGFLWAAIVGSRQTLRLSQYSEEEVKTLLLKHYKSQKRFTRENLTVVIIIILASLPTLFNILYYSSIISQNSYLFISNFIYLIFLFLFVLAYFEISPEPSSVSKKMVGISLASMLAALSIVGSLTMATYGSAYENRRILRDMETLQFTKIEDGCYQVTRKPLNFNPDLGTNLKLSDANNEKVKLDFKFPFYESKFDELFVGSNGIVSFRQGIDTYNTFEFMRTIPKIAVFFKDLNPEKGGGVFFRQIKDTAFVTWSKVPDFGRQNENTVQLQLYRNGDFTISFNGISSILPGYVGFHPGDKSQDFELIKYSEWLPYVSDKHNALFEDFYLDSREYVHKGASIFIAGILISVVFIIVIFPLFFRRTITSPLKALLAGVNRVNQGDLEVKVTYKNEDEIGFLTRAFNEMIGSVKHGKEEEILRIESQKEEEILAKELERKAKELSFARNVQISMLPKHDLNLKEIDVVGKMRSASEVGGDYYDIIKIYDNRYCIAVGDATGHGVAAGLVVAMIKMALINSIRSFDKSLSLKQLFENLNSSLKECLPDRGMGMGLAIMIVNLDTMTADISAVGMPFPYLYNSDTKTLTAIEMTGPPLGFMSEIVVTKDVVPLQPGDKLIFHSDGFTERMDINDDLWDVERFERSLLNACQNEKDAASVVNKMIKDCDDFADGIENNDDMTMVVLNVK